MRSGNGSISHHFTVDVEEYFHASAMSPWIARDAWDGISRRSPELMARLIAEMEKVEVLGTFFVLGWLAKKEPAMVRAIADRGHEIASHGWDHKLVTRQTPEEFRESVRRTKGFLEDLTGREVSGFRAPSFSIVPGLEWAFDVLLEEGYAYDSSLFPVSVHPTYGYPTLSRDPHWLDRPAGRLVEVPMSTVRFAGRNLPAAGGAYFRFLPLAVIRSAFRQATGRGASAVFYLHPWELDAEVGRLPAPWLTRLRMTGGTKSAWHRLAILWRKFDFRLLSDTVREMSAEAGASDPT